MNEWMLLTYFQTFHQIHLVSCREKVILFIWWSVHRSSYSSHLLQVFLFSTCHAIKKIWRQKPIKVSRRSQTTNSKFCSKIVQTSWNVIEMSSSKYLLEMFSFQNVQNRTLLKCFYRKGHGYQILLTIWPKNCEKVSHFSISRMTLRLQTKLPWLTNGKNLTKLVVWTLVYFQGSEITSHHVLLPQRKIVIARS